MELDLEVTCYTQIQRRPKSLYVEAFNALPAVWSILLSTPSAWKYTAKASARLPAGNVNKHGYSKRRTWRHFNLGCDPKTGYIHCFTLTDNATDDASQLEPLLDQVEPEINDACMDGAYDTEDFAGTSSLKEVPDQWSRLEEMRWNGILSKKVTW